jgi:hypothetical protein
MLRSLLGLIALVALAAAPAAAGDGPLLTSMGDPGAVSRDGAVRYVVVAAGRSSVIESISTAGGHVNASLPVAGQWGTPFVGYSATSGQGLSYDGRTLVVQQIAAPAHRTRLLVVDTRRMRVRARLDLAGSFSFDALSPAGTRLYLIQFTRNDFAHYVVRAYDLAGRRLLPGRIADRTQRIWVMQGTAVTRTTSRDGRWVYTLYANYGGYPFVHALDTVAGRAHCIGLPLSNQASVGGLHLSVRGSTLAVRWRNGQLYRTVDTRTWRLAQPAPARVATSSARSWKLEAAAAGGTLALLGALALVLLRRRRAVPTPGLA